MVQINVQQGQGLIATFKRELKAQANVDTSKIDGSVWAEVMKEVSAQNTANKAAGEKEIFRGGDNLQGSGSKNFVVNVGVIEIAQSLWDKIVSLVTGKKPEQPAADQEETPANPAAVSTPDVAEAETPVSAEDINNIRIDVESDLTSVDVDEAADEIINADAETDQHTPVIDDTTRRANHIAKQMIFGQFGAEIINDDGNGNFEVKLIDGTYNKYQNNQLCFVMDANGSVTQSIHRDANGEVTEIIDISHDEYGNIIDTYKDANGNLLKILQTAYDGNGNRTSANERIYDQNGKIIETVDTTYDKNGRPTHVFYKNSDNAVKQTIKYEYKQNGNIIETHFDANGKITS